jgi:hypothetical protein
LSGNNIVYSVEEVSLNKPRIKSLIHWMNRWTTVVEASQMGNWNIVFDMSHLTKIANVADIDKWTDVMTCSCGGS